MQSIKSLYAIDSHTMGEPIRVILEGFPDIPGSSMMEKRSVLQKEYDYICKAAMNEPRGHQNMFGAILFPPISKEADLGVVFMDGGGYLTMCGHGTIGMATVAVEEKLVPVTEPYTELKIEAPAGIVHARVHVQNGRALEVSFTNVPSFLSHKDVTIDVPGIGGVHLDVAYGGNFFAIVDSAPLDLTLSPEHVDRISSLGSAIRDAVNSQLVIRHPLLDSIATVELVEFYGPATNPKATLKNVVFFGKNQLDRSPCGTGTSAKIATLYAKGLLKMGEPFVHEGILGTLFTGRVVGETTVGEYPAVIPEITGRAFVTGKNQLLFEDDDPFQHGFNL